MGDCKDQTKLASKDKSDKPVLGIFSRSRGDARVKELEKKVEDLTQQLEEAKKPRAQAQTFADHVECSWDSLNALIKSKEGDVKNEAGREQYNKSGLALLKAMQQHIGSIMDLCDSYQELK